MIIRDILSLKGSVIISVTPEDTVAMAVSIMVDKDIGSVVVMDSGRMAGMVTFREVLKLADARGGNLGDTPVSAIMVREPVTGSPGDTVDHLRDVMTTNHVRYLPVLDQGALLGVISFHDVAKATISKASFENRLLKEYIKNWPEA